MNQAPIVAGSAAAGAAPAAPLWRRAPLGRPLLGRTLLGLVLLVAVVLLVFWPRPVWGAAPAAAEAGAADGARLFELTCAGCHPQGGNILRRGRTLKLEALRRQGIEGPKAIAAIAATGIGQMGGYAEALGPQGPEAVAEWVWQQALEGWPRMPG